MNYYKIAHDNKNFTAKHKNRFILQKEDIKNHFSNKNFPLQNSINSYKVLPIYEICNNAFINGNNS